MSQAKEMITINARIDIAADSLQTIVANAKKISGSDKKGIYRIDTAEKVNELISDFLENNGFDEYIRNLGNYTS
jgi:hypothetical protein